jgi:MFS family permease
MSDMRPEARPEVPRRALIPVLATGLATNVYADFMLVVVPLWALQLGASPSQIGIMIGARSVLPFLLTIHGGILMDRLGTRRMMLLFTAVTALLIPLYPVAPWFPALVTLQMLTGLFANLHWVGAQTLIARLGKGDAHYLGIFAFVSRVGSIVAPVLIGFIWDTTGVWGGFTACFLIACTMLATVVAVPAWGEYGSRAEAEAFAHARAANPPPPFHWRDALPRLNDYVGAVALMAIPAVALGIAVALLRHTPSTIQSSFYITYLKDLGLTATAIGFLIACAEVTSAFGSLFAATAMRRIPIHWLLIGLTAVTIALMTATPLLGGIFVVLAAAQVARGVGHGLLHPATFSFIAKALPADAQARGVALRTTGNRLGALVLPVVMGFVAEAVGVEASFLVTGFGLLAIVAAIAVVAGRSRAFRRAA